MTPIILRSRRTASGKNSVLGKEASTRMSRYDTSAEPTGGHVASTYISGWLSIDRNVAKAKTSPPRSVAWRGCALDLPF